MFSLYDIHATGDYLSHEKLWVSFLRDAGVHYRPTDFLFQSGRWRGIDWEPLAGEMSRNSTLVVGHSDRDISKSDIEAVRATTDVRRVFATNLTEDAAKEDGVSDLPLGIPNRESQSRTHIIQGDQSLIRKSWARATRAGQHAAPRIYANFSVRTNPLVRAKSMAVATDTPGAVIGQFVLSKRGRLRDLENMARCGLVVCPEGNGFDTHRFWECLLVGAFPLVLKTDHCARLARGLKLPHLALDSWDDLKDSLRLREGFDLLKSQEWDFSALSAQYWVDKISQGNT